ncbi:flagellar hook-length control protein FliK [Acuticoccus sp.]|uniref:flagellar hook-length control protein FliK n=1 Tax=Acuticoccus sp. TaxID=1904378 RepID=UPI003B5290D0
MAAEADAKVVIDGAAPTVLRRETHFAPVMPSTVGLALRSAATELLPPVRAAEVAAAPDDAPSAPIEQLQRTLERVLAELRSAAEAGPVRSGAADVPAARNPGLVGPVRVVELQLQPATLGTLSVTMRLSPTGLKVSVVATTREAAARLGEDRAELVELVRRAGYEAAEITVSEAGLAGGGGEPGGGRDRDAEQRDRDPTEGKMSALEDRDDDRLGGRSIIV